MFEKETVAVKLYKQSCRRSRRRVFWLRIKEIFFHWKEWSHICIITFFLLSIGIMSFLGTQVLIHSTSTHVLKNKKEIPFDPHLYQADVEDKESNYSLVDRIDTLELEVKELKKILHKHGLSEEK